MFRVYATTEQRMPLEAIPGHARRAEDLGFDGLCVPEAVHDGLLAAALALQATTRLRVATSVLVAFPRSPMTTALAAWDLHALSRGRFELGLGSQVRGNIVKRYGTSWSAPAPRMREYVGALRAIFETWQHGTPLHFEGEHYRITRMQPFFAPEPVEAPPLRILLGGIGPAMTALAGEVADGLVTHPTHSAPRYLAEALRPRVAAGARRVQRDPAAVELQVSPLIATGATAEAVAGARESARQLLGFLYSTPAYRPSLEFFGWGERGDALHGMSRAGRWDALAEIVDDDMLATFAPSGTYGEIAGLLAASYRGLSNWLAFPLPPDPADDDALASAVAQLRAA